MRSPQELSKHRQTLHLQAEKWGKLSRAASARQIVASAAEVAFYRSEAEKCRQALKQLSGRTKQQQRAGW